MAVNLAITLFVLLLSTTLSFAPQSPRGTETFPSTASVRLAWNASSGSVDGYRVYFRTKGDKFYTRYQDAGPTLTLSVTGLQSKTTYWFVATAYSSFGESDHSNEVSYRTASR